MCSRHEGNAATIVSVQEFYFSLVLVRELSGVCVVGDVVAFGPEAAVCAQSF